MEGTAPNLSSCWDQGLTYQERGPDRYLSPGDPVRERNTVPLKSHRQEEPPEHLPEVSPLSSLAMTQSSIGAVACDEIQRK